MECDCVWAEAQDTFAVEPIADFEYGTCRFEHLFRVGSRSLDFHSPLCGPLGTAFSFTAACGGSTLSDFE